MSALPLAVVASLVLLKRPLVISSPILPNAKGRCCLVVPACLRALSNVLSSINTNAEIS